MFAYCNNNPVNYVDKSGKSTAALQWWTAGMSWLPFADTVLPIGDIIYAGGILLLGIAVLASGQDNLPTITYAPADGAYGPPSPNDDDDDDDYYDDDSNFGGREKIGKNKGNAPRSNKAQNAQFNYAAKKTGIKPNKVRAFYDYMSGQGGDVKELLEMAETFLSFLLGYFCFVKE